MGSNFYDQKLGQFRLPARYSRWSYSDNIDITQTSPSGFPMWESGSTGGFTRRTTPQTFNVLSTSGNDASPSGAGARTLLLTGLNGNFDIQYETIVMNGSTLVATTGLYLEILELECLTFGSYGRNSARIVASSGAGINALIEPGMNKSNGAIFPVPRGYEARITRFGGNYVVPVSGEFVRLSLEAFIGEGKTTPVALDNVRLSGDGESCIIKEVEPIVVPEKSVVYMNGIATALNQQVWGGFDLLLLEKPK